MATTVGDYLLQRLREWGVDTVFGYAGDGINGLLAAWGRADNHPRLIQARHEEMAAFEAVGYAKFTGRVGVCTATSGPGAIHLLNGLYDAKLDHVPVVAIVGQTNQSAIGGSYQQEVDLMSLFKDVASEYVQLVTVPEWVLAWRKPCWASEVPREHAGIPVGDTGHDGPGGALCDRCEARPPEPAGGRVRG